jgi:CBS domain-containing protein
MPLYWYLRPRMVVLNPSSSVLEAARALEENRIGAVLVQDRGRLVGIVTDRDLAVRALGQSLDAKATRIAEVMTPSPVALRPENKRADAIRLMQEHNVRRIPLVEGGQIVGMVTLDDLLLDEAAPPTVRGLRLAGAASLVLRPPSPGWSSRSRRKQLWKAPTRLAPLLTSSPSPWSAG